jgi:hypothetical protein
MERERASRLLCVNEVVIHPTTGILAAGGRSLKGGKRPSGQTAAAIIASETVLKLRARAPRNRRTSAAWY